MLTLYFMCKGPDPVAHIRHHHHHLANMQLGHLLIRSVLTLIELSLMVFLGFFSILVCSFLSSLQRYTG